MNLKSANSIKLHAERLAFTMRLRSAFAYAGLQGLGTMKLLRMFNVRSEADVSYHTVRKWLYAGATPRQNHVQTLAKWLKCDSAWLRFGTISTRIPLAETYRRENLTLLQDLALLNLNDKKLVRDFISLLAQRELTSATFDLAPTTIANPPACLDLIGQSACD